MKVVVDANRIISALLKDGETRRVLLATDAALYAPAFLKAEIEKHERMLRTRSGLTANQLHDLLETVFAPVHWVPDEAVRAKIPEAEGLLGHIDAKDVPYLACALAVEADGIWSGDPDFDGQKAVRRIGVKELA